MCYISYLIELLISKLLFASILAMLCSNMCMVLLLIDEKDVFLFLVYQLIMGMCVQ